MSAFHASLKKARDGTLTAVTKAGLASYRQHLFEQASLLTCSNDDDHLFRAFNPY